MKSSLLPLLSHVFLLFVSPAVAAGGLAERQSCTDSTAIYCSSSTGSSIGGSSSNSSSSNSSSSSGGSSSGGSSSGGGYSSPDWIGNGALLTGLYNGEGYIKKRSDPGLQRRQDALCCPANSQCDVLGDNNTPVCYVRLPQTPPCRSDSTELLADSLGPRNHRVRLQRRVLWRGQNGHVLRC